MMRVAMWSGPRNLSTAMMRSWENRPDTEVMDEPLYAAYLASTGLDHPGAEAIIAAGPADADAAIAACLAAPTTASISYQKHMTHHLLAHMDRMWLGELRNCLLLRDPRRVLASYTRVRESVTLLDIGVPQQVELAEYCELVVDSDDFLTDPRGYQVEICRRLGVTFDESMLSWPAGSRDSDGVWAPYWYAAVESSTHFGPPPTHSPWSTTKQFPTDLAALAVEAFDIYDRLRRHRLVL
jgi:Sulfotransferase domain